MEIKIDKILEKMTELEINMVKQESNLCRNTDSLEEHMKRTQILESMIETLNADIDPIKKHVNFVKGAGWMLGIAGTILIALISTGILKKLI